MLATVKTKKRTIKNPTNWYVIDGRGKVVGSKHKTESDAQRIADLKNKAAGSIKFFVISVGNEAHNPKRKTVANSKSKIVYIVEYQTNFGMEEKTPFNNLEDAKEYADYQKQKIGAIKKHNVKITKKRVAIKNPTTKKRNPLDDKAIMLLKKLDRGATGAIDTKKLSTDEKAAIRSHSSYFYITKDFTGDKVRLTEKAYSFLEKGIENGKRKAVVNASNTIQLEYLKKRKAFATNPNSDLKKYQFLEVINKALRNNIRQIKASFGYIDVLEDKANVKSSLPAKRINTTKAKANYSEFEFDYNKGLKDLGQMFQGKTNGAKKWIEASDLQPKRTVRIGKLKKLIVNGLDGNRYQIDFSGEAYASMDRRKGLWFSGKDSKLDLKANGIKITDKQQECLGELLQINYITDKKHIENGALVEYYHKFGEVNREKPTLWADSDGFLIVNGGDYDIWKEGIVN